MSIEKEINQQKFLNEFHKASVNLMFTSQWLRHQVQVMVQPFGITMQQFNALRILRGQAGRGITTSEIRDRLIDRNSDASRLVDRLVKMELANRESHQDDRRLVSVTISKKGMELLQEIDRLQVTFDSMLANLSSDEAAELNRLLDKLRG